MAAARSVPAGWFVAAVFGGLIALSIGVSALLPLKIKDPVAECKSECWPRSGRLMDDKAYPMSAKGQYRKRCDCL